MTRAFASPFVYCTRTKWGGLCSSHDDCRTRESERRTRRVLNELARGNPVPPKSRRPRCAQ